MKFEDIYSVNGIQSDIDSLREYHRLNPHIPIFIWGGGSVACGVYRTCMDNQIPIEKCFVDSLQVHIDDRLSSEVDIIQREEISTAYSNICVVIGHSHYEMRDEIIKEGYVTKVFCLQDIVRSDESITSDYIETRENIFRQLYDDLSDDYSREVFVAFYKSKLTSNSSFILDAYKGSNTFFDVDVLKQVDLSKYKYIDVGAYDGKSIDQYLMEAPNNNGIVGIEVHPEFYNRLCKKYSSYPGVEIVNCGISNFEGVDSFRFDEQSTCLDSEGDTFVQVNTIDNVCENMNCPLLIKICTGNSIEKILDGAKCVINTNPIMVVSVGVGRDIMFELYSFIKENSSQEYSFYLRFVNPISEACIMYAIPK